MSLNILWYHNGKGWFLGSQNADKKFITISMKISCSLYAEKKIFLVMTTHFYMVSYIKNTVIVRKSTIRKMNVVCIGTQKSKNYSKIPAGNAQSHYLFSFISHSMCEAVKFKKLANIHRAGTRGETGTCCIV